ncbi:ATPase [Ramlibacter rhizophilus]|uniref:ATPase n=1 Tax=Ramlibacter rhizophilus TaxID=1781167 RepID=A0A4Z0BDK7_9BURK|nr:ATPase [Ramlibacter rhizophilus]
MTIAVLGAESTGKTQLCEQLAERLRARGHRVAMVPELLRAWCERAGRTPRPEEQLPIAREQEAAVDAAAQEADIVVADTSALMVALYSGMLFKDGELVRFAAQRQRRYGLTLLTGLDLPWVPDGLHRAGPEVRADVDRQLREQLGRAGVDWRMVYGRGEARTRHALESVADAAPWAWSPEPPPVARWQGACEACADPECEHRLFTGLIRATQ